MSGPQRHRAARRKTTALTALLVALLLVVAPIGAWGDDNPGTGDETPEGIELDAGVAESATDSASETGEGGNSPEAMSDGSTSTGDGSGNGNDVNFQQVPDNSFIYDTSISTLAGADSYYNNQTVQVTGEVIGDRINAEFDPVHCWVTLQATDGSSAQVIAFMTKDMTSGIDSYGAYGRKGTTIQVSGTYYLVCPEHEGVSDIHVDTATVVSAGEVISTPLRWSFFIPGALLVIIGVALMLFYRYLQERQR